MIRTRIAQAAAVAAVSLTALLMTPGVCAATSAAAASTAAVSGSDSLGWGGVTTPTTPTSTDSLGWGGVTQASLGWGS
ncbi:hypothetical protein BX285_4648 [Streptomyces sp. 1114.5]|uniref:hypothetical protein n=1 Tax=Streptomyces sp. 1114.5 TaxID=1938830 RepID=UPI000F161AEF|nr:hypothetical protein [Streptomyces sp. 1114.5]RKT20167.1 hypothetical protein BX285_4648 [Streptomyces sp. 1114.5]